MPTTQRMTQPSASRQRRPKEGATPPRTPRKTLITDGLWDSYDLASLLPLKEVVQENREFGFLLRHYWIPATELRFRQSSQTTAPDGGVNREESQIDRRMARCRSNECTWYETVRAVPEADGDAPGSEASPVMLCTYDCYEQTFRSGRPASNEPAAPASPKEAKRCALYALPMLCPPGPVPLGFSWHAKVEDDYMNYCLEKEERVAETSVLVIRREGRYTVWVPEAEATSEDGQEATPVVTERKGLTLLAWNRGTVLEDRVLDRIVETNERLALRAGTSCRVVTRTVRSCPTE